METGKKRLVVAVAGATGNCGKEVVRAAHSSGLSVRALVRNEARLAPVRDRVDDLRVVQVTDRASIAGSLDGADFLVSALGKTYQKDKVSRWEVDVGANLHLFDEASKAGIRRVALVSVFGADPNHDIALMRMKGEVEAALAGTGLPFVIVQPTGFYSDMWELFEMARRGTFWIIGDGSVGFNPIGLDDLGEFIVRSLLDDSKVGQRLPCGGPDTLTSHDIAAMAARVLGRPVKKRHVPLWLARAAVAMVRPFSRNLWEMGQFFVGQVGVLQAHGGMVTAPVAGRRRLEDYFRSRWSETRAAMD